MNSTAFELPPLPPYNLRPLEPFLPFISDKNLALALPIIAYWAVSLTFHIIDVYDLFPQYRLHTPAELLKRNHVSRYEVFRDVILQQIIQTVFGLLLGYFEPPDMIGKEAYDIALWAQRVRIAQRAVPLLLRALGLNAPAWSQKLRGEHPIMAGVLAGGRYPWLQQAVKIRGTRQLIPAFADWEIVVARCLYWVIVPVFQFVLAVLIVDTWQYFWHRAMHSNKWLYSTLPGLLSLLRTILINLQQSFTPATTAFTSLMPTARFTTTRSRASFLIHSVQALPTSLQG